MIALITPTGGRPKQIELCAKWMEQQTYKGTVLWVLVDDCMPNTTAFITEDFKPNWHIVKVRPKPYWEYGQNTQARNLLEGIKIIKKYTDVTSVFIIEDDDYYTPSYLSVMVEKLKGFDAAAQVNTIYYNVETHIAHNNKNMEHGSLFQTAFNIEILPIFELSIKDNYRFIDIVFWKKLKHRKINLFEDVVNHSVGIKGMPGREGIGIGHRMTTIKKGIERSKLAILIEFKKLIGTDYLYYV